MINSQPWHQYPMIQQDLQTVNELLQTHIQAANAPLQEALLTMANNGGKYLRPAMMLLMGKTISPNQPTKPTFIKLAASIEVLHMASLIHDDIIDDSPVRRGEVSIQARFGKDTAVYAGDYLFTVFFDLLIQSIDDEKYLHFNARIMQRLLNGELGQMANRFNTQQTFHQYLRNINGKTAALFQLAARQGAYFAGGTSDQVVHAAKFGQNIGLAFQMLDDILDYTGTSQLTKPVMEDLGTGVYSLPLLLALQEPTVSEQLRQLLDKRYQLTINDMSTVQELVMNSGALTASRELATKFTNRAITHLNYLPKSPARSALTKLAQQLLKRVN